jgi:copper chaperone
MKTIKLQLEPLTCPSCIKKIEGTLSKQNGVQEVKVLFNFSKVKVLFNEELVTTEQLITIVQKLGYAVLDPKVA